MSTWDVVKAAQDETAAERQLTQWQAMILVWGGLSWGATNQLLLDAAIDYLADCRGMRRAVVDEFVASLECLLCHDAAAGHDRVVPPDHECRDHMGIIHCIDCTPAPFCVTCTSPVCVCGVEG